jgi:hypothetical protein
LIDSWIQTDRRIGKWSAIAIVIIAIAYVTTGAIWLFSNIDDAKVLNLSPSEPYLTIMETLMLLLNPALIALFAAIYGYAASEKKTYALASLAFVLIMVTLTSLVHFIQLFVVRRTTSTAVVEVLKFDAPGGHLSATFAADMLAWDFFFGFAMLFAAPVFKGDGLKATIRASFIICGTSCLVGVAFPATEKATFQLPAIVGYAFVFPFISFLLARLFARSDEPNGPRRT